MVNTHAQFSVSTLQKRLLQDQHLKWLDFKKHSFRSAFVFLPSSNSHLKDTENLTISVFKQVMH